MKSIIFIFLLISTKVFSQDERDSISIVKLLFDDYATLGNWDAKLHMEHCTENYVLIENGEIWGLKKEIEYFLKNAGRIIDRKNYFDIKYIRVYGNYAYSVYYLRSDIFENGNLRIKKWVESTIFRKIKSKWKIELINSTILDLNK